MSSLLKRPGVLVGRDEELGKKDDNYRQKPWAAASNSHNTRKKTALRWRRRRLLLWVFLGAVAVYLFIHNMPTDLPTMHERMGLQSRPGRHVVGGKDFGRAADAQRAVSRRAPQAPTGPPPRGEKRGARRGRVMTGQRLEEEEHYYSGQIKFYKLKASLDAIKMTDGHKWTNRNVLFAVSRLKSAANLLPLACTMANHGLNYVHLILLGREALPVEDILAMNGIDQEQCDVFIHDARPDYSEYSTDVRAEASVIGAMAHVNSWMHPQVVITDDERVEDAFFMQGMRGKMRELGRPIIELSAGKYEDLKWMTRLDSSGLSSWHKPRIELLIDNQPGAGGGLLRLLKSLFDADYSGLKPPKLTVELPSKMDDYLVNYLAELSWPPGLDRSRAQPDLLKLQRRIPTAALGAEESAVRFVESYYPSSGDDDHVLILSPNAAVSPAFYHYVLFTVLSTRYSASGANRQRLAGLSLTTSPTTLAGKKFVPPSIPPPETDDEGTPIPSPFEEDATPPFLYQVPQASALLVFGAHWADFHDYLTRRLHSLHTHGATARTRRLFPDRQPAWLEFLLELTRARSWVFLYPATSDAGAWVTLHSELYKPPEEYTPAKKEGSGAEDEKEAKKEPSTTDDREAKKDTSEPFLTADDGVPDPIIDRKGEKEVAPMPASQSLHLLLPFKGPFPPLNALPLLSFAGEQLDGFDEADDLAIAYVRDLRQRLGGCSVEEAARLREVKAGKTGDLFCYKGREGEEWEVSRVDGRMFSVGKERMTGSGSSGGQGVGGMEFDGDGEGLEGVGRGEIKGKNTKEKKKGKKKTKGKTQGKTQDKVLVEEVEVERYTPSKSTAKAASQQVIEQPDDEDDGGDKDDDDDDDDNVVAERLGLGSTGKAKPKSTDQDTTLEDAPAKDPTTDEQTKTKKQKKKKKKPASPPPPPDSELAADAKKPAAPPKLNLAPELAMELQAEALKARPKAVKGAVEPEGDRTLLKQLGKLPHVATDLESK